MNYSMGCFVGRIWNTQKGGPCIVKVKDGFVYDITSKETPTVRDLLELENVDEYLSRGDGYKPEHQPISEDEIKKKSKAIMDEYLHVQDIKVKER